MQSKATIVFTGSFVPEAFRDFVDHRARRLDLDVRVSEAGRDRIIVSVGGQADLIDAFEMACSFGPIECLVMEVGRLAEGDDHGE